MSLIERAAKRLEELRQAGAEVSGELSYSPTQHSVDGQAAPSTIERAVQKLGVNDPAGAPAGHVRPSLVTEHPARTIDEFPDTAHARREPSLGRTLPEEPQAQEARRLYSPELPTPARSIELDLAWLASAGYLTPEQPESQIANEFRKIKRPLINACQGKAGTAINNANRIMVTSSLAHEGKTFVALNLAMSLAMEQDSMVLLIDADPTRPGLSRLLRADSAPGLMDVLTDESLRVSDVIANTNIEKLAFLAAGAQRPRATELLASELMENLLRHLVSRYPDRILIFDAPPLLAASEAAVLAGYMGQIVVVVEANKTPRKVLLQALETIDSCQAVMTVLNKAVGAEQAHRYTG